MLKQFPLLTLLLCALVFGFSSCDDDDAPDTPAIGTITDQVQSDPQFSVLASAIERTDLDAYLDVPTRRLTVFAPTDAAFAASGVDLAALSDDELRNILNYHIITGTIINSGDIADGDTQVNTTNETAPGPNSIPVKVTNSGGTITLDDNATVTTADIVAVNGTIHIIDQLLIPPTVADRVSGDGQFSTLLAALERTGLDEVLSEMGSYTIFAPTNDAFDALVVSVDDIEEDALRNLLLYHVIPTGIAAADIPGGMSYQQTLDADGPEDSQLSLVINNEGDSVMINNSAKVTATDVFASNGVVHAIDMVLSPQSLVDFVVQSDMLDSLEQAVIAAGLLPTLNMDGPFTVFAPINSAFTAASDTIATLTPEQIEEVLTYHVVIGSNVTSDELVNAQFINGAAGEGIEVIIEQDQDGNDMAPVLMNPDSSRVNFIITDIQGTNGVLHLIDGVLLPKLD